MELQSLIQISFMETLRFGDMGGLRIAVSCFSRMMKWFDSSSFVS